MRSPLFGQYLETKSTDFFTLQNPRLLKINLNGDVLARQGSMVAYQGQVDFEYEGSGAARFIKKALTGEGLPLMRCHGQGDLFLADGGDELFLIYLENEGITVNGRNVLAFDSSLQWDVRRVEGASMFAGGLFNTVIGGTGWVAVSAHGTPVVLQTDRPTYADAQAAIAWSTSLQTSLHRTVKLGALVGRGSGEAAQLAFAGEGWVIVQASEGPTVPPHSHGS